MEGGHPTTCGRGGGRPPLQQKPHHALVLVRSSHVQRCGTIPPRRQARTASRKLPGPFPTIPCGTASSAVEARGYGRNPCLGAPREPYTPKGTAASVQFRGRPVPNTTTPAPAHTFEFRFLCDLTYSGAFRNLLGPSGSIGARIG